MTHARFVLDEATVVSVATGLDENEAMLPESVVRQVHNFLLDKATGNITMNVKDGRVLGLRIERVLSVR